MPDMEKVLKGLECCLIFDEDWFYHCDECPYRATEDERKVIDWCCHLEELRKDALELLKAQESVAPVLVPTGYGAGIVCNCGVCGTELFALNGTNVKGVSSVVRFCRMCGKAVKWD